MKEYSRIGYCISPLGILSRIRRRVSVGCGGPTRLVLEKGWVVLPSAIGGVGLRSLQSYPSRDPAISFQTLACADCLLLLFLATCFLCDTASSTSIGFFAERLIAPMWRRLRKSCHVATASLAGGIRSLRQWLCSPSRIERNLRPFRSVSISHNPPPYIPSRSTHC